MSRVDPKALIGKRVFIETDKEDYIGTLVIIREYALELEDYYQVHKHDGKKIIAHGTCGSYTKIIMHTGGSKEMMSIKLNTLEGDLFAQDESDEESSDVPVHDSQGRIIGFRRKDADDDGRWADDGGNTASDDEEKQPHELALEELERPWLSPLSGPRRNIGL